MTEEEAMNFIHEKLWQGSKPGLSRTAQLLSKIGDPQKRLRFIHIAGTNGKGSTSAMLYSILQSANFRVGLFTSPFISRFNERMQVNGSPISGAELADITKLCAPAALSMSDRPTEFELVTAIAFEFYARQGCDLVVLETGMGGRLDSTNVIEAPLCSVITNIGLDHTRELGDTVEKIAVEKAGIIKRGCPTVIYDLPKTVRAVIESRCNELSSPLFSADFSAVTPISHSFGGQVFSYKARSSLKLPLLGAHQQKNAAVALECVEVLRSRDLEISEYAVFDGLSKTNWPGRFELLSKRPYFVVDGGHNPQCAETVAENLSYYFPGMKTVILLGVLADKDYMGIAKILSTVADAFVAITPPNPRALPAAELAEKISCFGKPVTVCGGIETGIRQALELAGDSGVVCSVGSLYTAGTVKAFFDK